MGLKTTNYEIKNLGITLPEAYAVIGRVTMNKYGDGWAVMNIQASREKALSLSPLDTKTVKFTWDRQQDIAACIYAAAKQSKVTYKYDHDDRHVEEVTVEASFADWEDDIVDIGGEDETIEEDEVIEETPEEPIVEPEVENTEEVIEETPEEPSDVVIEEVQEEVVVEE